MAAGHRKEGSKRLQLDYAASSENAHTLQLSLARQELYISWPAQVFTPSVSYSSMVVRVLWEWFGEEAAGYADRTHPLSQHRHPLIPPTRGRSQAKKDDN